MPKFLPDNHTVAGKRLRPQQVEVLRWLDSLPANKKVVIIISPTGSGKSVLSRAIQEATGGSYLAPTNALVNQYVDEFDCDPIYGKAAYKVEELEGHSLTELRELAQAAAMNRLRQGQGYFAFNTLSFALHNKLLPAERSRDMVIDEAHAVTRLISLQATLSIKVIKTLPLPPTINELTIIQWLRAYSKLVYGGEKDKIKHVLEVYDRQPEIMSFTVAENQQSVHFTPVIPPIHLLRKLFTPGRKFLLSATLPPRILPYLIPGVSLKDVEVIELDSDFPVENRLIRYEPVNYRDDSTEHWAMRVPDKIAELYSRHGRPNTLIHSVYSATPTLFSELQKRLPGVNIYTHTPETKQAVIEQWKETGGILIGCGMAEGIDLPDDYCRLNIVCKVMLADIGAKAVAKRRALEGGELVYKLSALIDLIQALGRGVRHNKDWCHNYCLDPLFPKLLMEHRNDLPRYFLEAVRFEKMG